MKTTRRMLDRVRAYQSSKNAMPETAVLKIDPEDCPICLKPVLPWSGVVCFCCQSRYCEHCFKRLDSAPVPGDYGAPCYDNPERVLSERCAVCRTPRPRTHAWRS